MLNDKCKVEKAFLNNNGYLKLTSINSDNWEDGVKMKVEGYQLVEP
ncbi:hypothetical protein [Clostridium gasigenes]|nr:hypothetical protein [Clostridium gasigenes]